MNALMIIFAEDTFAVLGFASFAVLVYYLIAGALGRRFGYGRVQTVLEKKYPALARRLRRYFRRKDST